MQSNEVLTPPPQPVKPQNRQTLALVFFGLIAALILYAAWKILATYMTPILLALVIVTFTYGLYRRLTAKFGGRQNLAAVVMLLIITFTIVLPAAGIGWMLVDQATNLAKSYQGTDVNAIVNDLHIAQRLAFVQKWVPSFDPSKIQPQVYFVRVVRQIPAWVAQHGPLLFSGLATSVLNFFLMLLAAFFFYTEGEKIAKELIYLSPLPNEYDLALWENFRGVIDATFRGQILTALAQGAATGLGLWIAGVQAPLLWGAVAAIFALIPMVGPAMVWVPAAIYLFLGQGDRGGGVGWGIFMIAWGALVVSLIDNVVRPWAMKGGLDMSAIVVLFSIFGGLQAWGIVGLVLGPLVFAMLLTVIRMYRFFFARTLDAQTPVETTTAPPPVPNPS